MLYLKACPKCSGDVKLGVDIYGKFLECIQCAFTIDSPEAIRRVEQSKVEAA